MGRKNIFETALTHQASPATTLQDPALGAPARRHGAPALETLGSSLRDMSESGIQELDPALIIDSGVQDRIELDPGEIARLSESIRTHGQQVPILVRPHPDSMNRFIIVYGRRRLAAIRKIGPTARVKAIVRHLAEDAAILAQGQENSLRVDPSYIEKALFVRELKSAGYDSQIIQDALGIDRTAISKMSTVVDNVPLEVILHIGAAPDIGRRLWTELAQMARDDGIDLRALIPGPDRSPDSTGSDRFDGIYRQAKEIIKHSVQAGSAPPDVPAAVTAGTTAGTALPASRPLALSGRHIGTLKKTGRSISLNVSLRHQPQFGQWFEDNVDEILRLLHDRWTDSRDKG
ncbi:plasmid partitioning protein RepB [Falsirhodobacter algicola]|uniref:Plasmid partitioning protein RepB n=1 Tax=Falsirhodobacter algicola TaxID=2692330 RepID=A0A8J8MW04_9RHOB|nr:plasmid partitioning protein RepB [Falsirhodobacter algicola]QUS37417.1 plasmid partitioning protein RepB [Falsirhodobacter algicola]